MQSPHRRAALRGTTSFLLLTAALPALAQETPDFLGTIELGESKREVQTETAAPVTEIDREEIEDRQAATTAELIDSVPGVNLVNGSTPHGSGINIRGFGANSTFGTDQKVKVIVDGAEVGSEEIYRIGTQLFTDPALYREVTVVRGTVGSFEYGSGIVGGVVQLDTVNASDVTLGAPDAALRQTLQYATNGDGLFSSTILAWQPLPSLEFLANYTWRDQNDQEDGAGRVIGNSAFTLPSWLLKARYSFGAANEHSVALSLSETETDERDVPYDTFGTSGGVFGNVDRQIDSRVAAFSYRYTPLGTRLVDFEAILSYADQEIVQDYVPGSSPAAPPGGFPVVNADNRYETAKLALKNTSLFQTGAVAHRLRTGIELSRRDRLDAESAPGGTDDRLALFAIDEMRIGSAWTITPALRWETSRIDGSTPPNDGRFRNSALMGGLSARYAFGGGFAVFASAAYTENLPIIDDLGSAVLMNQSEKARTLEIGASYAGTGILAAEDALAVKANLYSTNLWDVTSYTVAGSMTQRPDRVETQGIEIEASYALASGYYIDLNANIASGDEQVPGGAVVDWRGIPADEVQVVFGRRFGNALDLSWEVVADREKETNGTVSPGHVVHNLRATWIPQGGVLEGSELRVGLENAFDLDYTPHLSTRPAPERNLKLTLARTF